MQAYGWRSICVYVASVYSIANDFLLICSSHQRHTASRFRTLSFPILKTLGSRNKVENPLILTPDMASSILDGIIPVYHKRHKQCNTMHSMHALPRSSLIASPPQPTSPLLPTLPLIPRINLLLQHNTINTRLKQREHQTRLPFQFPQRIQNLCCWLACHLVEDCC